MLHRNNAQPPEPPIAITRRMSGAIIAVAAMWQAGAKREAGREVGALSVATPASAWERWGGLPTVCKVPSRVGIS